MASIIRHQLFDVPQTPENEPKIRALLKALNGNEHLRDEVAQTQYIVSSASFDVDENGNPFIRFTCMRVM